MLFSAEIQPGNQADTSYINSLARRIFTYTTSQASLDSARYLIDRSTDLISANNLKAPALLYLAKAEFYLRTKEFDKVAENLSLAYKSQPGPVKNISLIYRINDCNARYCTRLGLLKDAIDIYKENLNLVEQNKLTGLKSKVLQGLSNVYQLIGDQKNSVLFLRKMLEAANQEHNLILAETAHYNLGSRYIDAAKEYDSAVYHLKKSLELSRMMNDSFRICTTLNKMAWAYYQKKLPDSALFYYDISLYYTASDDLTTLSNVYGNIGTIYRDKKDLKLAGDYYAQGIEYAKSAKSWYNLSWIYLDMSRMYEEALDYKRAFDFFVLYKQSNDSLNATRFNERLLEARVKFDADTKAKDLELLSLKLKNRNLLIYGFVAFLGLSALITFLLIRQSWINTRRKISEMNQKISEMTQANLRQQMNPHFIFNTLNSIQYYMYQHDKIATNNYLTMFSNLIRKILENSRHNSVTLHDELDAVRLYLDLELIRFKERFDYEIIVDEEIDLLTFKVPSMLMQPYVENAVCHGLVNKKEKGHLKIELSHKTDHILCLIEDDGIGRDAAMEIKRNRKETNHNSLGTRITESRLDTLNLIYGTSLKTTYTDLVDKNGLPTGTRVEIQIPILS